jgi:hypothetical protein
VVCEKTLCDWHKNVIKKNARNLEKFFILLVFNVSLEMTFLDKTFRNIPAKKFTFISKLRNVCLPTEWADKYFIIHFQDKQYNKPAFTKILFILRSCAAIVHVVLRQSEIEAGSQLAARLKLSLNAINSRRQILFNQKIKHFYFFKKHYCLISFLVINSFPSSS